MVDMCVRLQLHINLLWVLCTQAFAIIEEELGRPIEDIFSSISEMPVAAASLGQVGKRFFTNKLHRL